MEISQKERFLKIIKFAPAVFLVTVSALIIAFLYFENKSNFETEKKELEEKFVAENKQQIKDKIIEIKQFIKNIQTKMPGKFMDESEIGKLIQNNVLDCISMIKFGKSSYIFVVTYDGIYLNHARKNYIGKHYLDNNDAKNITKVIEDLTRIAKNGGGYYTYLQNSKPGTEQPTQKVSYVEGVDEWNWMIGTGFYEDEIEEEILKLKTKLDEKYRNTVRNIVLIDIFLLIILLIVSRNMSNYLVNKLR